MKKLRILQLMSLVIVALTVVSCGGIAKMVKKKDDIKYTVTPSPLEMHGDSVALSIDVVFPPKFFHKKVAIEATPVIVYDGGEQAYETSYIKGEGVPEAKGTVISKVDGGKASFSGMVPYKDGMQKARLVLRVKGTQGKKEGEFEEEIALGTVVTSLLVQSDDRAIIGQNKFVRIVPVSYPLDIHYQKDRHVVRPAELRADDVKNFRDIMANSEANSVVFKGVVINAYASPEGEQTRNSNLSDSRSKSAAKAMKSEFRKGKIDAGKEDAFYTLNSKGEDWDGFKKLVNETNISEKQTIMDILNKYVNLDEREEAIRSVAAIYKEVENNVLPQLRRSDISVKAEEKAREDVEIKLLMLSNPDTLRKEELSYAGDKLALSLEDRRAIYASFARIYADDWRGSNNVAVIDIMNNKLDDASGSLANAEKISESEPVIMNNKGVIERKKGNRNEARDLYESASSAGSDVNYNIGIVDIQDGEYSSAVSNMSGSKTFNAALAKLLAGDAAGAMNILDESEDKDTGIGYYLKAIISARMDKVDLVVSNLKSAIGKDPKYKKMAADDAEFIKYRDNDAFKGAVN